MLHIEREIAEQPEILRRLLSEGSHTAKNIARAIREFDPAFVCIAARGTSDNAGRYAQYLMGIQANLAVALATPSVHTLYESPPNLSKALVIGISQSGQAADVLRVLTDARQQGALTVSITNNPESPMAQDAAYHLDLMAGEEISVAATKTYTAQLTAVAMLGAALVNRAELDDSLMHLPEFIAQTLETSGAVRERTERYRYMERFAVIGRGYNYCTAFEISLKIKELCYIIGEEYSEADFRHGPIAVIRPGFPVIVIAPGGKTQALVIDLLQKLNAQDAECIVIGSDETLQPYAQTFMRIPADIPEWLSPIAAVIPGQIFAMQLAQVKGYDIDQPRGLHKVTITE